MIRMINEALRLRVENERLHHLLQQYRDRDTDRAWQKIHRQEWIERCAEQDERQEEDDF